MFVIQQVEKEILVRCLSKKNPESLLDIISCDGCLFVVPGVVLPIMYELPESPPGFFEEEGTVWWHAHSDFDRATVHGAIVVHPKRGSAYSYTKPHKEMPIILGTCIWIIWIFSTAMNCMHATTGMHDLKIEILQSLD